MQITGHATNQDLTSEIDSLCDSDSVSYPLVSKVRRINGALEELIADILLADGNWEWDDTNQTTNPIGTGTLVEAQAGYTFASEYLFILEISIKDLNGKYIKIDPIDRSEIPDGMSIEEYYGTGTGFPVGYDKLGDTITLYPAPTATAVTLSAGLKIHFQRTADLFTTSDTTQEPGLPSTHHILLAYMASVPYCVSYKKDRVPWLEKKIDSMRKSLIKFFAHRAKDERNIMRNRVINFR